MLNPTKTQCIFIGNRQFVSHIPTDTVFHIDGDNIHPSNYVKHLGVYMDHYMVVDVHVNELKKKEMGVLMYINRKSLNFDENPEQLLPSPLSSALLITASEYEGTTKGTSLNNILKLENFAAQVAVAEPGNPTTRPKL